jgi:long-chain acyl-CoA synthetase
LLAAVAGQPTGSPAISPDGDHWLTVGDLLDRADQVAAALSVEHGSGQDGVSVVPIPAASPVEAVACLLAAQRLDAVPVIATGPATTSRQLLAAAARLYRADPGGEPLLVVVTSGSSGSPRAVVRSTRSWQASLAGFDTLLAGACAPGEVIWVPGGVASTLTLFGLWHALATGRPVIASGRWRGTAGSATGVLAGVAATAVQCVPAVLADILDARAAGQLPDLRRAVVAGAGSPDGLRRRAAVLGVQLAEYYGAAELSFVAADPDGAGLRPFPGAELAIRDGVIWVRSPYVARGYLDSREAAPGGGPLRRDTDGWASVGDRGQLSPEGVLTVRGRGDDTASVGGNTVILDDVECALADVPGVAEMICLPVPDARFGERVVAVARLSPGTVPSDAVTGLRAAARERLPSAARPARYIVREQLPRTPGGKVARGVLAAELAAALPMRVDRTGHRTLPA